MQLFLLFYQFVTAKVTAKVTVRRPTLLVTSGFVWLFPGATGSEI